MRKIIIAILIATSVTGCTQLTNDWNALTGASVNPTAVIVGGYSFDALEATATVYLRQPKCNGSNGPICRNVTATKAIIPAVRSARLARNNAEDFLASHPGQLGNQGLYDAMVAAGKTLLAIFTQYGIQVKS
jgi:hypothetical protein